LTLSSTGRLGVEKSSLGGNYIFKHSKHFNWKLPDYCRLRLTWLFSWKYENLWKGRLDQHIKLPLCVFAGPNQHRV